MATRREVLQGAAVAGLAAMAPATKANDDTRQTAFNVAFLHAARTADDIIFRQELELIAARTGTSLGFICERAAEKEMDEGFLTKELLIERVPNILDCTVLTCGPAPYMNAVKSMLGDLGFDMAHYHEESFGNPKERNNPEGAKPEDLTVDSVALSNMSAAGEAATVGKPSRGEHKDVCKVTFSLSGKTVPYSPGQTILDVATREGIAIPTNCQMGLCGTCKAKCLSGDVHMDDTEGLEPGELEQGMVLTCCGRPKGPISIEL